MNKKRLFITLIVAVSMAVFLLGSFEKVDAASNLLENKKSGDVVKFAGVEWVLLNPSERYIVMKDYWLKDGKPVTAPFNTKKTNKFDPSQKENIGYILNTEYYNTLSNIEKGMVVESVWDISPFLGVGIQTVRAKIGLLSLREWLEYKNVLGNPSWIFWTLTPHAQNNEQVFAIGADGNSNAWSTWKPEWPTVTHPALKLKPGVFVNPLTSELQPLEDDKNPPTISFEPNGNTTKQKVHSTKVWVYDWFGSGVEEATYRWKKGNQYVTGNIRMNEYPMIINTPDNGDGEYYLEVTAVDAAGNRSSQVSKPFVVGSLEVTSVNPLADISVDYGTTRSALPLPSTVQVTLSDQSIRSLGVTWDDGTPVYDGNTAGEYTFTGTLSQDVSNPQGLTAEVKVVVHPKPAEPPIVSSVESLNDIEVSYGTERSALPLPPTVLVILSDQTSQSLGVTWDDGSPPYNGNTAGEYTFTGTLAQDVSNPQGLTAEVKVVVHPKPAEPPIVSSVESLDDIEVAYGTERSSLPLPSTVQVTLSDQINRSLGVTWDDGTPVYDGNAAGEYTFTGTLAQDVPNPQNLTAEVKVIVHPKPAEPLVVESVESQDDIEVSYGTERSSLPLPSTVQVTLSDQSNRSLGVTWDDGTPVYDGNAAGEYTFTGTLAQDVSNPQGLTAEVKVVVHPKPAEPPVVSSVESLNDIEVSYGTERSALPLPPTVLVILSDQTSQSLGVTWDDGSPAYNGNTVGEYTFTGTLAQDVSNPQGLTAKVKMVVRPFEPDTEAPQWPDDSELTVSDVTQTSVKLSWPSATDNVGVTGYRIYVDDFEYKTAGGNENALIVNDLTAETSYTFKVTAYDEAGNESAGLTASAKTLPQPTEPDTEAPQWPDGSELMVSDVTQTSVKLSWPSATDNVGVTGYRIYVDDFEYKTAGGSENAIIVTGLTAKTSYMFKVTAHDEAGNESATLSVSAKTLPQPSEPDTEVPQWPDDSELTVSDVTQTSVKLSWPSATDNVGVTGYRIYVDDFEYKTAGGSENAIIVTGLTAKTSYMFKVTAHDEAGNESATLSVSAKTLPQPSEPDTEVPQWPDDSELTVSDVTQTSVKLSWPSATDNVRVTGYRIYVDDVEYKTAGRNENALIVNGLTAETSYKFKVTAYDEAGNESAELSASAKTLPQPMEPDTEAPRWPDGSELTVSDITQTSVKLTWPSAIDNVGVTGYRIYVDEVEYKAVGGNVKGTMINGLATNTSYTFKVTAYDAVGNESTSLSKQATTAQSSSGGGGTGGSGSGGGRVLSGNAELQELQVWDKDKKLELSPSFAAGTTSFTARTQAEQVEIMVKPVHFAAKVMLKEKEITDRTKEHLEEGDNTFVLTVQAENGTKKKYTLTIYRETPKPYEPVIEFTDIAGHWAENHIKRAAAKGIVSGYPDGTFQPNHPVTRAEFTVMLTGALRLEEKGAALTFNDNDQIGAWAKQAVAQAVQAGIIDGYEDGSFRPNASVTRAEMAVMVAQAIKRPLKAHTTTGFVDDEAIPQWAKGSVEAIRGLSIVSGRAGNKFVPNDTMTRAEAATILLRMVDILK